MNILYIGDVMAEPGLLTLEKVLPGLRRERKIDFVLAQAENASAADGKGIGLAEFNRMRATGVDFCTSGNHIFKRDEINGQLNDPNVPIVRPANYPDDVPGVRYKYASTTKGKVLVISLMGQIVGRQAGEPVENPLQVVDAILDAEKDVSRAATIINFHGDFSSEKLIIGYYLDGRASAVIGDHWHVPTADAEVLPKGTAHITDVGMVGSLDSSLGVEITGLITRWRDGIVNRNVIEHTGRMQFNALLVDVDEQTGLARSAEHIRQIL
jgi:2',3'-cyclic-nucleotide 2'-phosphodiesterase